MTAIFIALTMLVIIQLIYPVVTIALAQLFGKESLENDQNPEKSHHFACIITAYKNAAIALPLVESLLRQSYKEFTIYLVADECEDLDYDFTDPRFVLLRPENPLRLKVRSIRFAVDHFIKQPDFIVILDADNLAHPQFLEIINDYVNAGHCCIQGQRRAKNLDTTYAALDSLGEHYKNYIERRVPYLLGGSAVISGSGMATETQLYLDYLNSKEISLGHEKGKRMLQEDKILQNFILHKNNKIAYAHQAIVYDEKVANAQAVETQRGRWLYSYFQNMPNALGILDKGIFQLNFNKAYFGFVTLVLPMFIQVGIALMLAFIGLWLAPWYSIAIIASLMLFAAGVIWSLYLDNAPAPVWKALKHSPRFIFRQVRSLWKTRNPDKHFQHTEHNKEVSVDDVLKPKP